AISGSLGNGVHSKVAIKINEQEKNTFAMKLNIRGSSSINFLPMGRDTRVNLSSKWNSPSFNGCFLPKNRTIDANGFKANWEIYDYNREFPQQWKGKNKQWNYLDSRFGLQLFSPVDEYQKTTRSIKYAILFISLTFLAFFLVIEIMNKRRIHPVQYLLVGFALCIFYLLLISLSEHVAFDTAYLISSICITVLTTV
ncbi:MAG: cell envelope integrity protein CreD, partial [bacterium]|nr:cell envelope integrity protein CreD [bacterium]